MQNYACLVLDSDRPICITGNNLILRSMRLAFLSTVRLDADKMASESRSFNRKSNDLMLTIEEKAIN